MNEQTAIEQTRESCQQEIIGTKYYLVVNGHYFTLCENCFNEKVNDIEG